MFSQKSIAVLTLAANVVLGVPTWRRSDLPSLQDWKSKNLESYYRFKIRYRHIGCVEVEGTDFYNQCCVPLPKGQPVPEQCIPAACSANTQSPTAPAPASTPPATETPAPTDGSGSDGNDGEEDCEDDSDTSAEDTGDDDSNLPYCDEVSGDYEPVPVTSQSQSQPTNPAPEPTTTTEPEPTTPPTDESTTPPMNEPTTTTEPEPTTTAPDNNNGGNNGGDGEVHTGGIATFYNQDGSEGACGGFHSDSDLIGAMNQGRYGDSSQKSSECGRQVRITNPKNGKEVVITIVDDCPTCPLINSIDLSPSAFNEIADPVEGEVPISWVYLS